MRNPVSSVYRPDIDGLRAVAVLSVMIYHLQSVWLPGGYVGVDVFFVISGFVVASSLAASRAGGLPGFLSEFYARRLARIIPALVLVLIFSGLTAVLFMPTAWISELSEKTTKAAFYGLSNLVMQRNTDTYFGPRAEFNPSIHTWSLGVEEQYYLAAPFFVYFWLRAYRNEQVPPARVAIGVLAALLCASLAASIWTTKSHPTVAFYSIFTRLWELASGALLFLLTCGSSIAATQVNVSWIKAHRAKLQLVTAGLGLLLVACAFVYADSTHFPWPWALLPIVGTLLLIGGAGTRPDDPVRRVLAAPIMVWIGKRSYSLYLWHWPVFVLMRWTVGLHTTLLFVIAVGATFALSALSYQWVEQPLRHNARLERRANWVRITVFILIPIVGYHLTKQLFKQRARFSQSNVVRESVDWYVTDRMPYADVGDRKCTVAVERQPVAGGTERRYVPQECRIEPVKKRLYVLGDSHTWMLGPVFEQLGAEAGMPVTLFESVGCGYIDFNAPLDDSHRTPVCVAFNLAVTQKILNDAQPGDIILLSSLRMRRYGDQWASFDIPDMYEAMYNPTAMASRLAAEEDAKKWLRMFADKDLKVVFSAPTPIFQAPAFRCSDWFNAGNPVCIGNNQQDRAVLEKLRKPIVDAMHSQAQTNSNVSVWDAFPLLCPDEICRTHKDGRPLFFDGDHLSAYGNRVIYPDFKKFIMQ